MITSFTGLPSHWTITRVDRVATVSARIGWKALTAAEYQPEGYAFLATPNIKSGDIDFENVNYISAYRYEESPELKLAVGDVLLAKDGNTLGITNLIGQLPRPATVNGSIAVIRPFGIHPGFLRYVLASDVTQQAIGALKGGMGVPHLFQWDINRLPVHLPPLEEQRRIADFLDVQLAQVDGLTNAFQRLRAALLARRAAAVHTVVIGLREGVDLRPVGLAWAETVPSHWKIVRLGLVAQMGSGHTPSRSQPNWWKDCTIPWITTGEVSQVRDDRREVINETREKISAIGMANSAAELHPAGTVVLCRTASAGYSAVMGTDMATSQDFVTWACGPRLDPYYLLWCLRAMRPDLLGRLAMGSTHKTIYLPDLQMLRVPLPPLDEQRQIVDQIRSQNARIDAVVDAIDRQVALLSERRQVVTTAAVTGQIDVTMAGRAAEWATTGR